MKKLVIIAVIIISAGFIFPLDKAFRNMATASSTKSIDLPAIYPELKKGEGQEIVDESCSVCHSTDYISTQPKFSKAQWTATVNKMIRVFGATVDDNSVKKIIEYLAKNYGTGN